MNLLKTSTRFGIFQSIANGVKHSKTMVWSFVRRWKLLVQVCLHPTSKHIHNAWWSWGDHVGLALSCLISNGRLPGDSACQPPEPPVFSQVPYGWPSPIPLAGLEQRQEQVWTPALLAFPWHCHRACPAHCQLPTLGQRTQQPLPT